MNSAMLNSDQEPEAIPNHGEQGVFWSEPVSQGGLRKCGFFDKVGNLLPVNSVFDRSLP